MNLQLFWTMKVISLKRNRAAVVIQRKEEVKYTTKPQLDLFGAWY